jgi:hypothetical protein
MSLLVAPMSRGFLTKGDRFMTPSIWLRRLEVKTIMPGMELSIPNIALMQLVPVCHRALYHQSVDRFRQDHQLILPVMCSNRAW